MEKAATTTATRAGATERGKEVVFFFLSLLSALASHNVRLQTNANEKTIAHCWNWRPPKRKDEKFEAKRRTEKKNLFFTFLFSDLGSLSLSIRCPRAAAAAAPSLLLIDIGAAGGAPRAASGGTSAAAEAGAGAGAASDDEEEGARVEIETEGESESESDLDLLRPLHLHLLGEQPPPTRQRRPRPPAAPPQRRPS